MVTEGCADLVKSVSLRRDSVVEELTGDKDDFLDTCNESDPMGAALCTS